MAAVLFSCGDSLVEPEDSAWVYDSPEAYGAGGELWMRRLRNDIAHVQYNAPHNSEEVRELNKRFDVSIIYVSPFAHYNSVFIKLKKGKSIKEILTIYGKGETESIYGNHPLVEYASPCFGVISSLPPEGWGPNYAIDNRIGISYDNHDSVTSLLGDYNLVFNSSPTTIMLKLNKLSPYNPMQMAHHLVVTYDFITWAAPKYLGIMR
jgi:hypothetical protein